MSSELRPLKIEQLGRIPKGYYSRDWEYDLDSLIFQNTAAFDVAIYWCVEANSVLACIPNQSVLEMLSLHFNMNYRDPLKITGAHTLWIGENWHPVKERLATIMIPDPSDYNAVVKYIKETPKRECTEEDAGTAVEQEA